MSRFVFKLVLSSLCVLLPTGCANNTVTSATINLVDFSDNEKTTGETGQYFKLNPYLSVVDDKDHTYLGSVEKVVTPSNGSLTPYNDKIKLSEVGLYRVYFTYNLTKSDTRYKTVYIDSKDTSAPEVYFKEAGKGYLGVSYTLPTAISSDDSGLPVTLTYQLYYLNEEGQGREEVDSSATFVPEKLGTYSYEATATDCYDNQAKSTIEFAVTEDVPSLHTDMTAGNYTSVAKVSHTGGAAVSSGFDAAKGCFTFVAKNEDNFYVNALKSTDVAAFDKIRIKTKCDSKVTNTFIQAELEGTGKGNSFAYYDRVSENGYTYFEMSVEKFLPYWSFVSFNHAIMIILTNGDADFEFYGVELIKNADVSYDSPYEANVNESYTLSASCAEAIGATFTYEVTDPMNQSVTLSGNSFVPKAVGRYVITSTIHHFFYQGSKSVSIDVTSNMSITVDDYVTPSLGDTFTLPKAHLGGETTGFTVSVTRNGSTYPVNNNQISIDHNGQYVISYQKEYQGVTYLKRIDLDVGVTHLNTFSTSFDLAKAYGAPTDRVTSSYVDEFDGEQGVAAFSYSKTRWPNLYFACPNLSHYDMNDYSYLCFKLYLPDSLMNLNARYGENNESQDLTYYEEKEGIDANQWSTYCYNVNTMFNNARYVSNLPLYLIGVERSESTSSISGTIYVSDIYLTEKEADTIASFDSISGVSTLNVDKVTYLDNYQGEHSVIQFTSNRTYPQLFFKYGDISQYDINDYDYISFKMWMDDDYQGLYMRKGANNSVDVPSFHKTVRGFSFNNFVTGQWVKFYYPISAFINADREGNDIMLISFRDESLSKTSNIYISEITLEKMNHEDSLVEFDSPLYCRPDSDTSLTILDSFEGENNVAKFAAPGSFPNVAFDYQYIDNAIELGYTKLVFKVYLSENIRGAVLRYGANNATDDATYSRWTIGQITVNSWTELTYPIDRFINSGRGTNPLLLIFQKDESSLSNLYFSRIYLAK